MEQTTDSRLKVSAEEIREVIAGNHETAGALAEQFDVCQATVRNRIKRLRNENDPVIHSSEGYILIDRQWLENTDNAIELEKYASWIVRTLKGLRPLMKPLKPLLPQMKKTLSLSMTKEERHEMVQTCAGCITLLAFIEAEEEE